MPAFRLGGRNTPKGGKMKRAYDTPVLEVVGSLVDTTGGNKTPVTALDANFPSGTRFANLTWS
jgi:hypothetical protein